MNEIRVTTMRRDGRKYFEAQWNDPVTGKRKRVSTKKTVKRDADRFAAKLEVDLQAGPRAASKYSLAVGVPAVPR